MTRCAHCECEVETFHDETAGYLVCTLCGHIIEQVSWSSDPQFTKEGGEATVAGHFVSNNAGSHGLGRISGGRIYGLQYDSTEKASSRGRAEIERLVEQLGIRPRDDVCNAAHRVYQLAIQHNFTRGRRIAQIAAAAIYIICRQEGHPFMLLDFSDVLQVNVFVLGSVFLQLGKLLRLEEHPIMTRPVDPSLYLHRFADKLGLGKKMQAVANTALRLVSSMKRDWLQTGRKPAGITGAALYVASHIHGFSVTKEDVVRIVRVGVSTLDKRVSEFTATAPGGLTVVEFDDMSRSLEAAEQRELLQLEAAAAAAPAEQQAGGAQCAHIGQGAPYFACGMCKECYMHFLQVSGGVSAGANPPAFRAAPPPLPAPAAAAAPALEGPAAPLALPQFPGEGASDVAEAIEEGLREDAAAAAAQPAAPAAAEPAAEPKSGKKRGKAQAGSGQRKPKRKRSQGADADAIATTAVAAGEPLASPDLGAGELAALAALAQASQPPVAHVYETPHLDPKETLSDVSDEEAEMFLHSAEEVRLKSIVWTAMNQDYIDKQALKAACRPPPSEEPEGGEGADAAAGGEGGGGGPQKRPRGRPKGSKTKPRPEDSLGPSASAADGVRRVLTAKKLSSKINYEALDSLFDTAAHRPSQGGAAPADTQPQSGASAQTAASLPQSPQSPQRARGGAGRPPRALPVAAAVAGPSGGEAGSAAAAGAVPRPRPRGAGLLGTLKSGLGLPQRARREGQ